ncbi:MAG: GTP 3',8-cyclase MoaA [Candidatus Dormibacteria bacterium]
MTAARGPAAAPASPEAGIRDLYSRALRDVRISVTDRCNFRCTYCMPRASFGPGHRFLGREQRLTAVEIVRLGALLVRLGTRKIRLTGGEPLLRDDLEEIVRGLAGTGVADLALTTNGSLLERRAARLRRAGLHRLTVSLDSLDPAVHVRMSDSGVGIETVLAGIRAATEAGFAPIKLNCVLRRGINDEAVEQLVDFARANRHTLRFIEYMDVGESNRWSRADVVPAAEVVARVSARHELNEPARDDPADVAQTYRFADDLGEVGVIASVTQPFCGACTRLRVSADGRLHTCLFASTGTDILAALRGGDDAEVERIIRHTWMARTDRYSERRGEDVPGRRRVEMSYIGG